VLLIAAVDSAGVPLPVGVDAAVVTLGALHPELALLGAALAVAGSLGGSFFLFLLARKGGELYLDKYTTVGRGAKLRRWFHRHGLATIFVPALLPIPLPVKVPILCAGALRVRPHRFLAVMAAARVPRYCGLALMGARMGADALPWLRGHAWQIAGVATVVIAALYLLMRRLDAIELEG
jgi:membrane protein YqaA with SNARE-associated domain